MQISCIILICYSAVFQFWLAVVGFWAAELLWLLLCAALVPAVLEVFPFVPLLFAAVVPTVLDGVVTACEASVVWLPGFTAEALEPLCRLQSLESFSSVIA